MSPPKVSGSTLYLLGTIVDSYQMLVIISLKLVFFTAKLIKISPQECINFLLHFNNRAEKFRAQWSLSPPHYKLCLRPCKSPRNLLNSAQSNVYTSLVRTIHVLLKDTLQ